MTYFETSRYAWCRNGVLIRIQLESWSVWGSHFCDRRQLRDVPLVGGICKEIGNQKGAWSTIQHNTVDIYSSRNCNLRCVSSVCRQTFRSKLEWAMGLNLLKMFSGEALGDVQLLIQTILYYLIFLFGMMSSIPIGKTTVSAAFHTCTCGRKAPCIRFFPNRHAVVIWVKMAWMQKIQPRYSWNQVGNRSKCIDFQDHNKLIRWTLRKTEVYKLWLKESACRWGRMSVWSPTCSRNDAVISPKSVVSGGFITWRINQEQNWAQSILPWTMF